MSISTEIAAVGPRPAPRRHSAARVDLIVAVALVLLVVPTGLIGLAPAAIAALALLAGRAVWLGVAAGGRRRRTDLAALPRRPRRRGPSPRTRAMRTATIAALITLAAGSISFTQAITARSDSALSIRAVEWARDNGAQSLVSSVEGLYYTLTAPATGGPALKKLPGPGVASSVSAARLGPPDIPPAIRPRL